MMPSLEAMMLDRVERKRKMSNYKLVPLEPTAEMVEAAEDAYMPFGDMDLALRMAILTAPDVQGEPVAYAVFSSNGNIRLWCADPIQAETLRQQYGEALQPLYTAPQPAERQESVSEGWRSRFLKLMGEMQSELDDSNDDPIPSELWSLWREQLDTAPQPTEQQSVSSTLASEAAKHLSNWIEMDMCECEFGHTCGYTDVKRARDALLVAAEQKPAPSAPTFQLSDHVRKTKGSQWKGRVVGTYSTSLTPEGYAVESDTEKGSVQIYPAGALELVGEDVQKPEPDVSALVEALEEACYHLPISSQALKQARAALAAYRSQGGE